MSDPALIPRRLALRLCAYALRGQNASASGLGRKGTRDLPAARAAASAREQAAGRLMRMTNDDALCAGEGIDAAALGYLLAWLVGREAGAFRELSEELAVAHGRDVLSGADKRDAAGVVRIVVTGGG